MKANEEFATEVTHLYQEEEKWTEERRQLKDSEATTRQTLTEQLEADRLQWRLEREKLEDRLCQSESENLFVTKHKKQ